MKMTKSPGSDSPFVTRRATIIDPMRRPRVYGKKSESHIRGVSINNYYDEVLDQVQKV
jgi:hypothetical protein